MANFRVLTESGLIPDPTGCRPRSLVKLNC